MTKKKEQLGMSPGAASYKLVKDILFDFICKQGSNVCFQCGEAMCREDFSIEHKVPWLDSENPAELYFDLSNISYSHLSCNIRAGRKIKSKCGSIAAYKKGCRCEQCREAKSVANKRQYTPEKRQERYLRLEKQIIGM